MVGGDDERARGRLYGRTASVALLQPFLALLRARGVDTRELLHAEGLTPKVMEDFDHRIPEASVARLWRAAEERTGDPTLGLRVAESSGVGAYDALDYAIWCSSTLAEALQLIIRFHRVLADAWAIQLEVRAGAARIERLASLTPQETECGFALIVLRARELTGRALVPREVRFSHLAPLDRRPHAALFRCPVRFGRAADQLVLGASDLPLPIRSANVGLCRVLQRHMTAVLARLPAEPSGTFRQRTQHAVAKTLHGGRPTLQRMARALHVSARTLQRRLREDGTTLREVVDGVRRDLAVRFLEDRRLSVTEVAFLVGFLDVSGFRRTFKRWTGESPTRARSMLK